MKTEQEVREAITSGITNDDPMMFFSTLTKEVLTKKQVQDLAVIIGKALGVVE